MANRTQPTNTSQSFITVGSLTTPNGGTVTGTFQVYADHAIWDVTNNNYFQTWLVNTATAADVYNPYVVWDE